MDDDIDAQKRVRELQSQIRCNALETTSYLSELQEWEKDIRKKDIALKKPKDDFGTMDFSGYPLRSSATQKSRGPAICPTCHKRPKDTGKTMHNSVKRKIPRIKSSDYRAWDKFDVDKACDDMEYRTQSDDDEDVCRCTKAASATNPSQSNIKLAELQKSQGNDLFEKGKYNEALLCYTKAMDLNASSPVYPANRAMTHLKLKKFEEAEADCTTALQLDARFLKAYYRRATARLSLRKLSGAKQDLSALLSLDPSNKEAREKLKIISEWQSQVKDSPEEPKKTGLEHSKPQVDSPTKLADRLGSGDSGNVRADGKIRVFPLENVPRASSTTPLRRVPVRAVDADVRSVRKPKSGLSPCLDLSTLVAPSVSIPPNAPPVSPASVPVPPLPTSARAFMQACSTLSRNSASCADYIQGIDPSLYPSWIGQNLEMESFSVVLHGALELSKRSLHELAFQHLRSLCSVPRFSFFPHGMSQKDKTEVKNFFTSLVVLRLISDDLLRAVAGKFLVSLS